eukprot:scaffold647449_cov14-Prasinocladus_malaysianus.AAC.1
MFSCLIREYFGLPVPAIFETNGSGKCRVPAMSKPAGTRGTDWYPANPGTITGRYIDLALYPPQNVGQLRL